MMNKKRKKYYWKAINSSGEKITGTDVALTKNDLILTLSQKNIIVFSIRRAIEIKLFIKVKKLSIKMLLDLTQQLHWLLKSGMPLTQSLEMISANHKNAQFKSLCCDIKADVYDGIPLYESIQKHDDFFPPYYSQLIFAGEKSDQLIQILDYLIHYQKRFYDIRNRILKAAIYPLFVTIVALVICFGIIIFITPQFQKIYQSMHATLPAVTLSLINLSHMIRSKPMSLIMIFFIISALFSLSKILLNKQFKRIKIIFSRAPIIYNWIIHFYSTHWFHIFGILLRSGTSLTESIHICTTLLPKNIFYLKIRRIESDILNGFTFTNALASTKLFSDDTISLVHAGENADKLLQSIESIAAHYDERLSHSLDHLSKLIEPVIMIVVASVIAVIITALYLPIFRMGNIL